MDKLKFVIIILTTLTVNCQVVWKTCNETFCGDVRHNPENFPSYKLNFDQVTEEPDGVLIELKSDDANTPLLQLSVTALENDMFRLIIKEVQSQRYRNDEILQKIVPANLTIYNKTDDKIILGNGNSRAEIHNETFKIQFYNKDQLVSVINDKNRLVYEKTKTPIALDVAFPEATHAYGIPEHADHMALRHTQNSTKEPYRHFNLDYGSYQVESTKALYGAIGVLYARAPQHTSGIFWYNSAQTWIDVDKSAQNITNVFFMSESGIIELYVLTGPTLAQSVKQYTQLTGVAPLPQYFTLGYHQSRYSYMNSTEVLEVVDLFNEFKLPLDVMWLDIDYTNGMRYFTWDTQRFPKPLELQNELKKKQINLVAIIDPHFKVDKDYPAYQNAKNKHFIRKSGNKLEDYVAKCWPGDSSYIDFLDTEARRYYTSLYDDENFRGNNLHFWNDMNEPAVFEDEKNENTVSSDAKHLQGTVDHKDVHNIYGLFQVKGTWDAMMNQTSKGRPFILTRSHFAGIQRYAAIWTGDNVATWAHLKISFPMCLTEALAGVSFCGADIGGFAKTPSDELNQRWYQAGAWLPFYRGHSDNQQPKGREPYNNQRTVRKVIKAAMLQRYAHLPVWYTIFRHHELTGEPVIRPIIYEYPNEHQAAAIDDIILLGKDILVAPVLEEGASLRSIYFPGGVNETWFQIEHDDSYLKFTGMGLVDIPVDLDTVPLFYRGGSIITRKDNPQLTSAAMKKDSYTLYICLNNESTAKGSLYEDDHKSFRYKENNEYIHVDMAYFDNNTFHLKIVHGGYAPDSVIDKAVIINPPKEISKVDYSETVTVKYNKQNTVLTLEKLSLKLNKEITIQFLTTSKSSILKLSTVLLITVVIKVLLF